MLQSTTLFFLFMQQLFGAINILNLDYDVGTALGIGEFAGGIVVILILWLAVNSLAIYKQNTTAVLISSILIMGFGIVMGWLSIFFLILLVFVLALGIADRVVGIFKDVGIRR